MSFLPWKTCPAGNFGVWNLTSSNQSARSNLVNCNVVAVISKDGFS